MLKSTSSMCAAAARAERVFTSCFVRPFGVVLLLICTSALQLHCCLALLGAEPFAHVLFSLNGFVLPYEGLFLGQVVPLLKTAVIK